MSQEPVKAKLVCLEVSNLELKFPYNPKEFTVTRNSGFTKKNKGSGPWGGVTWECATPDQLKFDVVLDVSMPDSDVASASSLMLPISSTDAQSGSLDSRSVLTDIVTLHKMTIPRWVKVDKYKRPPFVAFLWGDFQFFGAIESVESKAVLFNVNGIPKRAEVSISMLGQAFVAPKDSADLAGAGKDFKYETLNAQLSKPKAEGDPRVTLLKI